MKPCAKEMLNKDAKLDKHFWKKNKRGKANKVNNKRKRTKGWSRDLVLHWCSCTMGNSAFLGNVHSTIRGKLSPKTIHSHGMLAIPFEFNRDWWQLKTLEKEDADDKTSTSLPLHLSLGTRINTSPLSSYRAQTGNQKGEVTASLLSLVCFFRI